MGCKFTVADLRYTDYVESEEDCPYADEHAEKDAMGRFEEMIDELHDYRVDVDGLVESVNEIAWFGDL